MAQLQFYKEKTAPVQKFPFWPLATWPLWPILQFYRNMHIPPTKSKSGQGGSTTVLQGKDSSCSKISILATGHLGHFGQFYNSTGICTDPLLRQNLARVAQLQFYKEKTAPVQQFRFWPLATWPLWPILQFYRNMHIPPTKSKSGQGG